MSNIIITNKHLLSRISKPIVKTQFETGDTQRIINKLYETINNLKKNHKYPKGLAAIQINEPASICIVKTGLKWLELINPVIERKENLCTTYEVCLSFPNQPFEVERFNYIKLRYLDKKGKLKVKTFRGRAARIIQHEIDHIDGKIPSKEQFEKGRQFKQYNKTI